MKIILFNLFVFLFSFNLNGEACPNSCIKKLKADIKKSWRLSADSTYYTSNFEFNEEISEVYRKCLIGCSKSKVKKLFGKPSKEKEHSFEYLVTPPPTPPYYKVAFLQIDFDENGKLKYAAVFSSGVSISD